MPVRYIKETICTSDNVDQLTPFQETVFVRLIVNCDDYGRFDGRPKVLSSRLFPLRDIPVADMEEAVRAMQEADLITVYEVKGRPYIQMKTWAKHQTTRAKNSKYPDPIEGNCMQMYTDENNSIQTHTDADRCLRNRNRNRISNIDNRNRITRAEDDDNGQMIPDSEARKTQEDHDTVLDAAEDAGFKMSNNVRVALIALYAEHGLDKILEALRACSEHGAPNLAYLKAVLKGEPKKDPKRAPPLKTVAAQQYEQRDYDGEQEAAMARMISGVGG